MAKVSEEARTRYFEKIRDYKNQIELTLKEERKIQAALSSDGEQGSYRKLEMAEANLSVVSNFLIMNQLSLDLLGIKNENFLNDARKACYKIVIYLEDVFSDYLDVPFSEYADRIEAVQDYPELKRFLILRKLGFSVQMVKDGFGENSKWKWSIIELEGRVATLSKNIIDLKKFVAGMDPRSEGFRERVEHFRMTCRLLQSAGDSYRMKYELSTNRMDDFKKAINYLAALKRFLTLTNQKREIEELKKKIDIWKHKMEADAKQTEKAARMKRLSR
jgi:glutaredoxin-related protein